MSKDWISIYATKKEHLAIIARNILADNNIESVIMNQQDSMYKFGDIEVLVSNTNVIKAKNLLKDFE